MVCDFSVTDLYKDLYINTDHLVIATDLIVADSLNNTPTCYERIAIHKQSHLQLSAQDFRLEHGHWQRNNAKMAIHFVQQMLYLQKVRANQT